MSIISDAIQAKCLAFSDRIIKLNDFPDVDRYKKEDIDELVKTIKKKKSEDNKQ